MNPFAQVLHHLGAALLPLAVGLLFEELTFGGLVRLILAPWPRTGKQNERNHPRGGTPCSR
ncbi:MAG: hypothetical protein WCE75_10940 [Terracidiphilus sp.]